MTDGPDRVIAICVVRKGDAILVGESEDPFDGEVFYRPLGGGIEDGETPEAALRREFLEEVSSGLLKVRPLAVIQNSFTFEGIDRRQEVHIFEADLSETSLYSMEAIPVAEEGCRGAFWKPLSMFRQEKAPLYPDGLLAVIDTDTALSSG